MWWTPAFASPLIRRLPNLLNANYCESFLSTKIKLWPATLYFFHTSTTTKERSGFDASCHIKKNVCASTARYIWTERRPWIKDARIVSWPHQRTPHIWRGGIKYRGKYLRCNIWKRPARSDKTSMLELWRKLPCFSSCWAYASPRRTRTRFCAARPTAPNSP